MKYNFDKVVRREETNSAKWEFGAILNPKADRDTLPLWVADMDFACAEPIHEAIKKRVDRQIYGYSVNYTGSYYRAVCDWTMRRFGWYIHSSDIMLSPGVVPALSNLVKALTKEGDGVIIQKPVYYPFMSSVENNNRVVINNALINNDGYYTIDFDDLEEKAKDEKTTMMILCSPHNPVGRVWTEEELRKIGDICLANDVIIVSDEIHYDIVRKDSKHVILDMLFPESDKIISCIAPSKSFNLAGMHTSHIIIKNEEFKKKWQKAVGMYMLSPLSISAVEAAYNESEDWLDQVNDYIDANMDYIKEFLDEHLPKAKYVKPEGTYLAWIDLKAYGFAGKELDDLMISDAKVLLDGGTMFGEEGMYHQRINASCPRSILHECLVRMANALNKLRKGDNVRNFKYDTAIKSNVDFKESMDGKTVLAFLRYAGCTICRYDIEEFKKEYYKLKEKGVELKVVLQSKKEIVKEIFKDDLPFEIICDPEQKLYKLYNLNSAHSKRGLIQGSDIDKATKAAQIGLIHGEYEGNEMQLPAVLIFDEDGKVIHTHYGLSVGDTLTVDEIIEKL